MTEETKNVMCIIIAGLLFVLAMAGVDYLGVLISCWIGGTVGGATGMAFVLVADVVLAGIAVEFFEKSDLL